MCARLKNTCYFFVVIASAARQSIFQRAGRRWIAASASPPRNDEKKIFKRGKISVLHRARMKNFVAALQQKNNRAQKNNMRLRDSFIHSWRRRMRYGYGCRVVNFFYGDHNGC
jgi:hypothetical protein